jgi:hypothetical protein
VIPCEAQCRVANGHVAEIKGKVRLHLSFKTREDKAEASCEFQVLEGLREELILGIRDILGNFRELFLDMLRQTSKKRRNHIAQEFHKGCMNHSRKR